MRKMFLCWTAFLLVSCSNTQLVPGAESILFTKSSPGTKEYEYIGEVSCSHLGGFNSISEIIQSCRNDLRNQAFAKSAVLVFIETEQIGTAECSKCITMFGSAYKKIPLGS